MCAPSPKQAVDPTSPNSSGSPEMAPPSQTGNESLPSSPSMPSHYGNFTNSPPDDDPASAHHLLQVRDYRNNDIVPPNDCFDSGLAMPKTRLEKLGETKEKLLSFLRQKRGVILTGAVFILYFNIVGWMGCYSVLFVSLQGEFGRNATETGWVGSLAFIMNCVCTPFIDLLLRRFSHRTLCALGVVCCFTALIISSFMPQLFYLFFTYGFLYGLGSGLVFKTVLDLLLNTFPDNCGRVSSLVLFGSTCGTFAWTPVTTALIDLWGWRNACRISAAVILFVCLLSTFSIGVPPPPSQRDDAKDCSGDKDADEIHYAKLTTETKKAKRVKLKGGTKDEIKLEVSREKRMVCMPEAWLFGLASLAPFISMGFLQVNFVSFAMSLGYTINQGSTVLTLAAASEASCKLVFAIFVDKLPFRKVHLMAGLSLVSTLVMLSCAFVPSFPILCVVGVGSGCVRATMNALPFAVGMEIFGPTKTSGSNTLVLFTGGLGTITNAFAIGGTYDAFGTYNVAIYICTGCFLLTTLLYLLIPLTSKFHKVVGVKVRIDEVTGVAEMVPVVEEEAFMIEEFVTVV